MLEPPENSRNKAFLARKQEDISAKLFDEKYGAQKSTIARKLVPDRNRNGQYKAIVGCCPTCGAGLKNQQMRVDLDTNTFLIRGYCVYLRAKEAELLSILVARSPGVVTHDTLASRLWGVSEPADAAKNIQVHVCRLRRALAPFGAAIISIFNTGYRFDAGVNHEQ